MSNFAAQIAEAEHKLVDVEAKIDEIEALKVLEPKLRREAAALTAKIAELREGGDAETWHKAGKAADEEEEAAPVPQPKAHPVKPRLTAADERAAKMKALNKKLKQIEGLKGKDGLDADQQAKVASEPKLRKQLAAVEAGQTYVDSDEEKEVAAPANFKKVAEPEDDTAKTIKLPTDAAEVDKRKKALKKKLDQISKLKEKGGALDADAKEKIAGEDRINQELEALEAGADEVTFVEKGPDDFKIDLEKKIKAINKKLESIEKLKKEDNVDADGKAKIAAEAALKKEKGDLTFQIGELNKKERERVAARLGFEAESKKKGKK